MKMREEGLNALRVNGIRGEEEGEEQSGLLRSKKEEKTKGKKERRETVRLYVLWGVQGNPPAQTHFTRHTPTQNKL